MKSNNIGVLLWADLRGLRNALRRVIRQPGRLVAWITYAVSLVLVVFARNAFTQHTHSVLHTPHIGPASLGLDPNELFAAGMLGFLGFALARGENPPRPLFANPIEARLLTSSPLRGTLVVTYLQLRAALAGVPRFLTSLFYILILFTPRSGDWTGLAIEAATIVAVIVAITVLPLPRELAPAWLRLPMAACGWLLCGIAVLGALEAVARTTPGLSQLAHRLRPLPQFSLGGLLSDASHGDLRLAAGALALAAAAIIALVVLTRDAFPELYEISVAGWHLRERRRARMRGGKTLVVKPLADAAAPARAREAVMAGRGLPGGAAILLWAEWVGHRRQTSRGRIVVRSAAWLTVGYVAAVIRLTDPSVIVGIASLVVGSILVFGIISGAKIGVELRRPLFWLCGGLLAPRLALLITGALWRIIVDVLLLALGSILGGAAPWGAFMFVGGAFAGFWLQRTIGVAAFAAFPRSFDQRGPMLLLRMLLVYVLSAPPVIVGLIVIAHGLATAVASGVGVAVTEGVVLLLLSARRLHGRVDLLLSE